MSNHMVRQRLEFVRGPMAKVQGAGAAKFKRITAAADVTKVQRGGSIHGFSQQLRIAGVQADRMLFEPLEERGITEHGDLDRFRQPTASIAGAQRRQEFDVIDDAKRRHKRAHKVLLPEQVHAVLDRNARVALRQRRGGQPDDTHAAVRNRGRKRHHVKHRSATDGDDEGLPVNAVVVHEGDDAQSLVKAVFDVLAARHHDWRADQCQRIAVGRRIGCDRVRETGMGVLHALIDDDQQAMATIGLRSGDEVAKHRVGGVEGPGSHDDGNVELQMKAVVPVRHGLLTIDRH